MPSSAKPSNRRNILTVPVRRFHSDTGAIDEAEQELVAVEEPLQIQVGTRNIHVGMRDIQVGTRNLAVTMRTPGNDAELAAGFLFTEGFVRSRSDIREIDCQRNIARVILSESVALDASAVERNFYITSSCGVCGKASIEALENAGCTTLPRGVPQVDASVIRSLPERLRTAQAVFERTGGLHASGLLSPDGELIAVREDVGRHNALDKLIGWALLSDRLPLHNSILIVSGRTSFELLQKSAMAGIPILAAIGAPSSLAVKTALRFGVTLIGFLRENRFNIYSAADRIQA